MIYYLNAACTFFFVFEALIKLVVLTPPIYFRNLWNTFSFLIVLGSVIEFIVQRSGMTGVPYSHIASTFRVLRLLQFIPRVKRILWTIIRSLKVCCFLSLPSPFPPPSLPLPSPFPSSLSLDYGIVYAADLPVGWLPSRNYCIHLFNRWHARKYIIAYYEVTIFEGDDSFSM